ncbi:MAG: mandelate racemase/muconate lactonizing enzyme family protein [Desulfobacterales bacterium]|jgi:L-alanine-DL-glutamate epimerase-like enolase superfamily enzyme
MKIKFIDAYQVNYRYAEKGVYTMSGSRSLESFPSTIVKVTADDGSAGYGEVCPLGSNYMDAYALGVVSGIKELAPVLIGQDPLQLHAINHLMDSTLEGHAYVKSPLDIACWDLLGRSAGVPVVTLLGGRQAESYPLYRAISQHSSEQMTEDVARFRSEGYRKFQLKVGGNPDEDIARVKSVLKVISPGDVLVADANRGWLAAEAMRVVKALSGENCYVEQPCKTLEECLVIRSHTNLPMVLDEVITGPVSFLRAWKNGAMDVVNLKISRLGGLTKAKLMRDMCEALGIRMTIEDSWGGDVTTATVAHLAGSTRPGYLFSSTDFNSYVDVQVAHDAPKRKEGMLSVPTTPGLGITVNEKVLGKPVFSMT